LLPKGKLIKIYRGGHRQPTPPDWFNPPLDQIIGLVE